MNQAYSKLLPLNSQSPPTAPQFLCQLTNISECVPIQDQQRVSIHLIYFVFIFFPSYHTVHGNNLESKCTSSSSSFPCTRYQSLYSS